MIKKLKYLLITLVFYSTFSAMDTVKNQCDIRLDEIHININQNNSSNNSNLISVNSPIKKPHFKRDSIILHSTPSSFSIFIENLKSKSMYKMIENIVRKNREGITVLCTLTTVLLLHFYYAEVSSFTYTAQRFAGISLAHYSEYKKINLFLMAIIFQALSEGIYLTELRYDFTTGTSTVCDVAGLYSLIKFLANNLFRQITGKNKDMKEIDQNIIIPSKYKKVLIEEVD